MWNTRARLIFCVPSFFKHFILEGNVFLCVSFEIHPLSKNEFMFFWLGRFIDLRFFEYIKYFISSCRRKCFVKQSSNSSSLLKHAFRPPHSLIKKKILSFFVINIAKARADAWMFYPFFLLVDANYLKTVCVCERMFNLYIHGESRGKRK